MSLTIEKFNVSIKLDPVVANPGKTTTLKAKILDENNEKVNCGRAIFKLNGCTLKDDNGNKLYANIVDGVAAINYTIPKMQAKDYILTIVVSNKNFDRTEVNTTFTVEKTNITIKINPIVVSVGKSTTLTAIVTDSNGNLVTDGFVIFKLNGCTLKDENGNAIRVRVINGVATMDYVLPEGLKAKDHILTAVLSSNMYNRAEMNTTITLTKPVPKIMVETPVVKRTNNTTIIIKLTDDNGNIINSDQKICVKFNGKTMTHTYANNGTITINMDLTNFKNKQYNLMIVAGENKLYNTSRSTSILKIE